MDIKKIFTKILSPGTYTERVVFIALGIYCIDRALFPFSNIDDYFLQLTYLSYIPLILIDSGIILLNNLLAIFSIAIGAVLIVKFGRKFKVNVLRIGLFGLGLWLIAEGVFKILPLIRDLNIFRATFSFGVGVALMIGDIKRGSAEKEMGIFLLGLYIFLIAALQMTILYDIVDYSSYYKFFRFFFPLLLFVAGVLVIVRQPDESIIKDESY